jgi:thiosulfate/3-mercaptopyruvate sulfurtransferase
MPSVVDLLVSVNELAKVQSQARLVDVRWKLGEPAAGRRWYVEGHVPGAVFVDMDDDLAGQPGVGGRHPLPTAEQFAGAMSRAGIGDDTSVIAYDDGGSGAARLWWLLRHFGHARVSILDGGYAAWLAAGGTPETGASTRESSDSTPQSGQATPETRESRPLTGDSKPQASEASPQTGGGTPQVATFTCRTQDGDIMDVDALQQALADGAVHLLDARAPERWRGDVEPVDRLPGRIPGSINAPSADQMRSGYFRTPEELRDYYTALGVLDGKPIVVSCGSGVSACVDLVGMELAGISGGRLCPGSFSGWIAHGLPVQTGAA